MKRIRPPSAKRLFRFTDRSPRDVRRDVDDEFAFHLDMRADELVRQGVPEKDARAQASREFGDRARGATACVNEGVSMERQRTLWRWALEFRQDASFGVRLLARSPAFATAAILTLALAIGGNATVFSLVNALAFKPLPVHAPLEIVRVFTGESQTSWPNYLDIARSSVVFTDVAAHASTETGLATGAQVIRARGETTSANYLTMLGVPAQIGRVYGPSERRTDIVVLSHRTWRTTFGSDPAIVGRLIALGGRRVEVLGVMPPTFRGAQPPGFASDFWRPVDPVASRRSMQDRNDPDYVVVARLKAGVTPEQAQAATRGVARQIGAAHPSVARPLAATEVFPLEGIGKFRGMTSTLLPLFLFVGAMTVVSVVLLLVGCANIAGLLLGRATGRRREIGVRLALGAGRGRLIRQLLTESLALALIGGGAGVLLANGLGSVLGAAIARLPVPVDLNLSLDRRALVFTFAMSLLTSVLCGLAPARRATSLAVLPSLKEDASAPYRQRLRCWLVVGQVGFSCALLLWGGLFLRSLDAAARVDPGLDPSGVVIGRVVLGSEVEPAARMALLDELRARVAAIPGVQSHGVATIVPLSFTGREEMRMPIDVDPADQRGRWVMVNRLGPGWLETVRIPLVAGRDFSSADRIGAPRVAIVNETAARQFWNGDAIGRRIGGAEVIGIARDSKYWTLGETIQPVVYTAQDQRPEAEVTLFMRTADVARGMTALRAEISRADPATFVDVRPMSDAVAAALVPARIGAILTGTFGAVGALLAMMGIYGLISFSVAERTREIGIYKAIGASTSRIVLLALSGTILPAVTGIAAGLGLGLLGARALAGFIVGVSPYDPVTMMGTVAVVLGAVVVASARPTLRAIRIDPLVILKVD
jgi:predicted permease